MRSCKRLPRPNRNDVPWPGDGVLVLVLRHGVRLMEDLLAITIGLGFIVISATGLAVLFQLGKRGH